MSEVIQVNEMLFLDQKHAHQMSKFLSVGPSQYDCALQDGNTKSVNFVSVVNELTSCGGE